MWLIIGLIMHAPPSILLIGVMIAIGAGAVGASIGWLINVAIYPELRGKVRKPIITAGAQSDLPKEIRVEYELDSDDVLAFYLHYSHSRRLLRRILLVTSALELLAAVVLAAAYGAQYLPAVLVLVVFAGVTSLYYVFSPLFIRTTIENTVKTRYGQGQNKLTGRHRLSVTQDMVTDFTDFGESTTHWNAVKSVLGMDRYVFIAVHASNPYIIPKRAFADEAAFRQFIKFAETYHRTAKAQ